MTTPVPHAPPPGTGRAIAPGRGSRIAAATALAALSVLPVPQWLGHSFQRALSFRAMDWISGTAIVLLLGVALYIVFRRDDRAASLRGLTDGVVSWWERAPVASTGCVAVGAMLLYVAVSWLVFDARPLLIDELVQVFQARTFTGGRLWLPLDAHPEFRSVMHMVEQDGRWYAQFPPGGPAMLALGELVRAPWIVNPLFGAVSIAAFASALRWSGFRPAVSLGATLTFALAPFVVFQSASHMNHVTALTWQLVAAAALVRATRTADEHPRAALVCGLALGVAATIRPLDAAAWALPAAGWLVWRALRGGQWRALILSGVGVSLPILAMMWVNVQTTGGALTFGYEVLWGASHGLGFHPSPWGENHTVTRGLALTAAYLSSFSEHLFDVPAPSLIPALVALALAVRLRPFERYLVASATLTLLAYFAYWHDGFFLGPRFLVPLVPLAVVLVAQLPELVAARRHLAHLRPQRFVLALYAAAVMLGAVLSLPHRVRTYASGFQSMRWDYDRLARDAGASGGIVLVRESWGAQVIHRLWALDVSRSFTEQLYRYVDTCGLDDMATRLEREGVRGAAAEARLRPMLADSARVITSPLSTDKTQRLLPGSSYPPICIQRIAEDSAGYTLFGPMLLARDTTTMWVRDLHARDTLVVDVTAARPVWKLIRVADDVEGFVPVFIRLNRDSLRATWLGERAAVGDSNGGTPTNREDQR